MRGWFDPLNTDPVPLLNIWAEPNDVKVNSRHFNLTLQLCNVNRPISLNKWFNTLLRNNYNNMNYTSVFLIYSLYFPSQDKLLRIIFLKKNVVYHWCKTNFRSTQLFLTVLRIHLIADPNSDHGSTLEKNGSKSGSGSRLFL